MKYLKKLQQNINESVVPALALVLTLVPATLAINWHTAVIDSSLVYTLAFANSLSTDCMPYFLFALLGFAFSHTENGKRIIMPINIASIALFTTWYATFFMHLPTGTWEISALQEMINTLMIQSIVIAVLPFMYFYLSGLRMNKPNSNPNIEKETAPVRID